MFRALFEEYKEKVFRIWYYKSVMELETYKKIGIIGLVGGIIIGSMLFVLGKILGGLVAYLIALVSFILMAYFKSRSHERKRIVNERIIPTSKKRLVALRKLLKQFGIEYTDTERVELLVEYAQKEKEKARVAKEFVVGVKSLGAYVVIPVVTYVLTKIAENLSVTELVSGMILVLFFAMLIMVVLVSSYSIFNDLFNSNAEKYSRFISDLQQVIIFQNYECQVADEQINESYKK